MKLRLILFTAGLTTLCAAHSASTFLPQGVQILAEDTLNLPYNETLACGGCIRAGYTFCASKDDSKKGRNPNDYCCQSNNVSCWIDQVKKDSKCSTLNQTFHDENQDKSEWYKDPYVMFQKFCMKRQESKVCCPKKNLQDGVVMNLKDDGKCEIELKKKNIPLNFTIFLNDLPYGGSCTYEIKAKCGYPQFSVNNSNIDMVVAYKKQKWDDDMYEPLDDESYSEGETYNPQFKDGKIVFKLPKSEKDDGDGKDEKKCKDTKLYLTLTNKLNPFREHSHQETARRLESTLTQVSDGSSNFYAFVNTAATDSANFMTFTTALSVLLSTFTLFF